MKAVIRSFIAIDLSPDVAGRVAEVSSNLQKQMGKLPIRWVPADNVHLTLKFLGDVSISNLERLREIILGAATAHHCFEMSIGGLGVFPGFRRPRVVWLGVEAPPVLLEIQKSITHDTDRLGYQSDEKTFSPHLTIGRVSRGAKYPDLHAIGKFLKSESIGFLGATRVDQIHLYQSDLKPRGAVYSKLYSADLQDEAG